MTDVSISFSEFAHIRHWAGSGNSYTTLKDEELLDLIRKNWDKRIPGNGETGLDRKVLVPIDISGFEKPVFFTGLARLEMDMPIKARVTRRQAGEDLYIETYLTTKDADRLGIPMVEAKKVDIVLYSKDALLDNDGKRSSEADWEIVAILAAATENEPMRALTMARNALGKVGGTKSSYSEKEYAEAVYYWKQFIKVIFDSNDLNSD